MSSGDILLSAKDLSVRFGGVLAVNKVSFDVRRGEVFTLIGPNGAGKTTVFNLISRIYTPTTGEITWHGEAAGPLALTHQAPHAIAALGIARTFQNIELFEHATVLHNLLIGRHTHRQTGFWSEVFFTPATRRAEIAAREKAEQVIELLDLQRERGLGDVAGGGGAGEVALLGERDEVGELPQQHCGYADFLPVSLAAIRFTASSAMCDWPAPAWSLRCASISRRMRGSQKLLR